MTEETVMTIDYRERYHDEIVTQSDESLIFEMRDDLIAAIDELRSTIAAQHDHIEDGARALERANERITELELLVDALNENGNAQQEVMMRFQKKRIEELESQLSAALATIERAAWCDRCNLPAEHCRENHGQLYSEGCRP